MSLKPKTSSPSPDWVAQQLRERILGGAYPGGSALRQEELAEQLG